MKIYHSISKSDSEKIEKISQLFSICAGMDEVSGSSEDFLNLLQDSQEDALEDDDLSLAAGGIKPLTPPEQ